MTAKHPDKHPEKHPEKPPEPRQQRVEMKSKGGDEVVVTHGTESYHVPREGHIDLPPKVAEHVIRQGGALPVDQVPPPTQGTVDVKNVIDPATTLGYGGNTYTPDNKGITTVPLAILVEILPHGYTPA